LGTFLARNIQVQTKTKQKVKASDSLLTLSILATTSCIAATLFSTSSENFYHFFGPIAFLHIPAVSSFGLLVFALSIVLGWIFSGQLGESWRVGVHETQKTELIQSGIYQYIRNPYFLSHFIMYMGLFLIRPSLVLLVLVAATMVLFHRLVLREEAHLLSTHGKEYEAYKESTGRYLPRLLKVRQE
jgi:protein-S-isoprenylcysteine O-methyltransferase Ste14